MNATKVKIEGLLIGIISDGFNRSIGALQNAGAINTRKMREHYRGIGSKYYDLVTEQIEYTARCGADAILEAIAETEARLVTQNSLNTPS